ncbi:MAG: hypothetical protein ABIN04_07955 [Ginsengibacter sp.]
MIHTIRNRFATHLLDNRTDLNSIKELPNYNNIKLPCEQNFAFNNPPVKVFIRV